MGSRLWLALLALLAVTAPWVAGPADPPTLAASAAQLLAPGARVEELSLEGGGFLRASTVEPSSDGLRIRSAKGWRVVTGVSPAGPVRQRRMWMGTDHLGRSLLARVLYGARTSLIVALVSTIVAVSLGTTGGLASALAAERPRRVLRVTIDGLLGLPRLLLLILLAVAVGSTVLGTALVIGAASWMGIARLVEAEARRLERRPFAAAVRATGAGRMRLAVRHVLPNLLPLVAVAAPLVATEAILLESTLAFLGLGRSDVVSWGGIVADSHRLMGASWWATVLPGVLLCATALATYGLTPRDRAGSLHPGAV